VVFAGGACFTLAYTPTPQAAAPSDRESSPAAKS
jgi:hypothetical protein